MSPTSCPRPPRRKGFTLIELLVVIAIIAILVSLLLPAVQKVREAANRAKCQNNLKQLGIAMHAHHDSYNRFPAGGAEDQPPFGQDAAAPGNGSWGSSWMVYLLPYIEQNAMYQKWQWTGQSGVFNANNITLRSGITLPTYMCPSSPLIRDCKNQTTTSAANYVAIAGAVNGLIPGYTETRIVNSANYGPLSGGGVLYPNSQVRFAAITDGTSNTMMLSEHGDFMVSTDGTKQDWRASQGWGWAIGVKDTNEPPNFNMSPDRRAFNVTTIRYPINKKTGWATGNGDCPGTGVCWDGGSNIPLNSAHTGGVNVAMCDGSVRFLNDAIDLATLGRLAVRDDGQVASGY